MNADHLTWEAAVAGLRADPASAALVRDSYLDLPVLGAARRYHASPEWAAVRAFLPENPGDVLDIGAGNGIASYAFAADGWHVTALEPDPSIHVGTGAIRAIATDAHLHIRVIETFGESIPLSAGSFDVVFARQVFHHARDLSKLAQECARVLRPGGLLITARDHVISHPKDLPRFLSRHPLHAVYGGEHAYTYRQYEQAIDAAGLTIISRLGTLDSPINYGPRSEQELQDELIRRMKAIGLAAWMAQPLRWHPVFRAACRLASLVDRRPGRLVSYIARKPSSLQFPQSQ